MEKKYQWTLKHCEWVKLTPTSRGTHLASLTWLPRCLSRTRRSFSRDKAAYLRTRATFNDKSRQIRLYGLSWNANRFHLSWILFRSSRVAQWILICHFDLSIFLTFGRPLMMPGSLLLPIALSKCCKIPFNWNFISPPEVSRVGTRFRERIQPRTGNECWYRFY